MPGALSKEEVVNRGREVHNNRYTYDRLQFVNIKDKGCVTCPTHGDFMIQIEGHVSAKTAYGCPECGKVKSGNSRRLTTEDFIRKAMEKHCTEDGEPLYSYSKTVYTTSRDNVTIGCKTCGVEFSQRANHHLEGKGCAACARAGTRRTLEDVIASGQQIHKRADGTPRYDYSMILQTEYKGIMYKYPIKCKECQNVFQQDMNSHIGSLQQGCPHCMIGGHKRIPVNTLLQEARAKFVMQVPVALVSTAAPNGGGNISIPRFDYTAITESNYKNKNEQLQTIGCNQCGEHFESTLEAHLKNGNCGKCMSPAHRTLLVNKWLEASGGAGGPERNVNVPGVGVVDGYVAATKTIYECLNCYHVGCEVCYPAQSSTNQTFSKTFEELRQLRLKHSFQLRMMGYNVVSCYYHELTAHAAPPVPEVSPTASKRAKLV